MPRRKSKPSVLQDAADFVGAEQIKAQLQSELKRTFQSLWAGENGERTVSPCTFKRKQKSKTERGIMIGEGDLIIDKNNKPVKAPIWTYTILQHEGCLPIKL